MKILYITISIFILISCISEKEENINQEVIELNNQALNYFQYANTPNKEQADSAILLLDKATSIDSNCFLCYTNKIMFYLIKQDYINALNANKELQRLKPEAPNFIIQEGLLNELNGDTITANKLYTKGLSKYREILNSHSNIEFDFKFEYINSLVISGFEKEAKIKLDELIQEYPNNEILNGFKIESKKEIMKIITAANNT